MRRVKKPRLHVRAVGGNHADVPVTAATASDRHARESRGHVENRQGRVDRVTAEAQAAGVVTPGVVQRGGRIRIAVLV